MNQIGHINDEVVSAMKSAFSLRMEREMRERQLSQSDLSRMIWGNMTDERGYKVAKNRQVLGKYLSGKVKPRRATLRLISKALNIPMAELDSESDPTKRPASGISIDVIDNRDWRIKVDIVAPKGVVQGVIDLLTPYAK